MADNKKLIQEFYAAFNARDFKTMQSMYADHATFSDAVFVDLNAEQVKAMWEMLLKSATDLKVQASMITANEKSGGCQWDAFYTFSTTGRKVHNIIRAEFTFENGKIVRHIDHFDLYRWSRMAFGASGVLMGWTPFLQKKIRNTAMGKLKSFMSKAK